MKNARELESSGDGLHVIDAWSFVDAPDIRPRPDTYCGLSRTQWTITVTITADT